MGPQYPLVYLSTPYEPDSAFVLKPDEVFIQVSGITLNSYVYTSNSEKNGNADGASDQFQNRDSGYSVYLDAEINRRFFKTYMGISPGIELQFTYRDIRFGGGNLDQDIDKFHNFFGLGSQGRENTARDQLEIYVLDNENNKMVWQLTESSAKFHQESLTLGLKLELIAGQYDALSLSLSSNFGDSYIESGINEIGQKEGATSFNDYTAALNYSSKFDGVSIYAAAAMSNVKDSLLEKSPKNIYYYFLGGNWHLYEELDLLLQILNYSSPFPEKENSTLADDIREVSMALRWIMGRYAAFELGFVENQTQGAQNIDITFFSSLMVSF